MAKDPIPFFVEGERIKLRPKAEHSDRPVAFVQRACLNISEDKSTHVDDDERKRRRNIR